MPRWTKKKPRKLGLYWVAVNEICHPTLAFVDPWMQAISVVNTCRSKGCPYSDYEYFLGPIETPRPPAYAPSRQRAVARHPRKRGER